MPTNMSFKMFRLTSNVAKKEKAIPTATVAAPSADEE